MHVNQKAVTLVITMMALMFCGSANSQSETNGSAKPLVVSRKTPKINPITFGSVTKPSDMSHCGTGMNLNYRGRYLLSRPDSIVPVAFMCVTPESFAVLNPSDGAEYENMPSLSELSIEQAEELWGKSHETDENYKTFSLKTLREVDGSDFPLFRVYVDCKFENDRLQQYRVRRDPVILSSPRWVSPQSERGSQKAPLSK